MNFGQQYAKAQSASERLAVVFDWLKAYTDDSNRQQMIRILEPFLDAEQESIEAALYNTLLRDAMPQSVRRAKQAMIKRNYCIEILNGTAAHAS